MAKPGKWATAARSDLETVRALTEEAQERLQKLAQIRAALIGWAIREGVPSREIAEALGITKGRISQLLQDPRVQESIASPAPSKKAHAWIKTTRGRSI